MRRRWGTPESQRQHEQAKEPVLPERWALDLSADLHLRGAHWEVWLRSRCQMTNLSRKTIRPSLRKVLVLEVVPV